MNSCNSEILQLNFVSCQETVIAGYTIFILIIS